MTTALPDAAGGARPADAAGARTDAVYTRTDGRADANPRTADDAAGTDGMSDRRDAGAPTADAATSDAASPAGCPGSRGAQQAGPLFGAPVSYPLPAGSGPGIASATALGVADVTGDGLADVVVGSWQPALVVYPQTRDGCLGAPAAYPIAASGLGDPRLLDVGDLDGDGRMDVVYPRSDGIGVMPGNAAGGLGPEQVLPSPPEATMESNLAVADVNGDGRSDLVVMPFDSDGVEVRLQDATGTLVRSGSYHCARSEYFSLAIGDADGDGRLDIALLNSNEICVLRQRSDGGFEDAISLPVSPDLYLNALAIGNFGVGVGGSAIAFTVDGNQPKSKLGLYTWSPAANGFAGPAYLDAYDIPEDVAVADVDGDGRNDVVVMHIGWEKVGVFRAAPAGGLAAEELYPFPYINSGKDRLAVADVNGDGRPDVLSVDYALAIAYHR